MNEVFLIGTVKEKIEFKFIVNSKKIYSKVKFILSTMDNQKIEIIGYNDIADFVLRNLKEDDNIFISGKIRENMEVEMYYIKILSKNLW